MRQLDHYTREMKQIADEASNSKKRGIGGSGMAWLMMIVGVIVTGTMTYALTRKGMQSSALWRTWVDFAAALPVVLLEGSALALVYGRHYWFRSTEQRAIANVAGWAIWIVLGITSVVHFAFGQSDRGSIRAFMNFYASYVLPVVIVAIPMLWKRIYDAAPESAMRIAVLESEADLRSQLVEVQREQNQLMVAAYREGMQTARVAAARKALFEQSSIEHAREIVGFIEGASELPEATEQPAEPPIRRQAWQGGQRVNGIDQSHDTRPN